MSPGRLITLYGRDGCHLCDEALEVVRPLASAGGARLEVIDLESDEELHRRYLERIPVICLDGEELYDFFVDERDLRARLGQAAVN